MKKINFIQPKFVLPAILFIPLLGLGWLVTDIFHSEMQHSGLRPELRRPSIAQVYKNDRILK